MLSTLVESFHFIVSLTDVSRIPFQKAVGDEGTFSSQFLVPLLESCNRQMCLCFNDGSYGEATRIAKAMITFGANNAKIFQAVVFYDYATDQSYPATVFSAMARYVQKLVPVYKYCKEHLDWNRLGGLPENTKDHVGAFLEGHDDLNYENSKCDQVITFIDMILSVLDCSQDDLNGLVECVSTREFLLDTFMDPIMLSRVMIFNALNDDRTETCRQWQSEIKKEAQGETPWANMGSPFNKKKYDPCRIRILRISMQMLSLNELFDGFLDFANDLSKKDLSKIHLDYRFMYLSTVVHLSKPLLFSFFENSGSIDIIQLLHGIQKSQMDLGTIQALSWRLGRLAYEIVSNDEKYLYLTRGQRHLKDIDIAAKIRADSNVNMTSIFCSQVPGFLMRYALRSEKKRIFVMDSISREPVLAEQGYDPTNSISYRHSEALAFSIVQMLFEFGSKLDTSDISSCLQAIVKDKYNHPWCEEPGCNKHNIKQKAKRYFKLIDRLNGIVTATPDIKSCVDNRKVSVDFRMNKLKEAGMGYRRLPQGFDHRALTSSQRKSDIIALIEVSTLVPQWNREDLRDARIHIIRLIEIGEKLTTLLSRATGNKYPIAISLFNDQWDMAESKRVFEFNTLRMNDRVRGNAIIDMLYVNAILEKFEESQKLSQ